MSWWWVSICDLDKPKGQRFVGVAIMRDPTVRPSWADRVETIANAQTGAWKVPTEFGDPPEEWAEQLICDVDRLRELTTQWHGCEMLTLDEAREQGLTE